MRNQLLEILQNMDADHIAVLLRHPAREDRKAGGDYETIPLTAAGKEMAFRFGWALPRNALVSIFHSSVPRCQETAQLVRKGILSRGGSVVLPWLKDFIGIQSVIGVREKVVAMLEEMSVSNLARTWLNGELDKTIMKNPCKVASDAVNGMILIMDGKSASQRRIDLYITHDWNILAVKEVLLNLKHEDTGWPAYLDGVVVTRDADRITMRAGELAKTFDWQLGSEIILRGVPASPGIVKGKITRVITSSDNIGDMNEGEVLVASETNPEYVTAMIKSSAIITDRGGIISHPAIVARELGIPGVVGTMNATETLKSGWMVTVDGNQGLVIKTGSAMSS